MKRVLDTNVVLYLLAGRLANPLGEGDFCVSVVTEIELLAYRFASEGPERIVRSFLERINIEPLSGPVKLHAISLRRAHRLKLPDAIIAGTALALDAELLTNDAALARVPGLRCKLMPLKNPS